MRVKEAARELKAQPLGRVLATAVYLTQGGGRSVGQSTFGGPVLGCIIDTSDGECRLNFRDFSRSTRSAFFCIALNSFSGKIVKNIGNFSDVWIMFRKKYCFSQIQSFFEFFNHVDEILSEFRDFYVSSMFSLQHFHFCYFQFKRYFNCHVNIKYFQTRSSNEIL